MDTIIWTIAILVVGLYGYVLGFRRGSTRTWTRARELLEESVREMVAAHWSRLLRGEVAPAKKDRAS